MLLSAQPKLNRFSIIGSLIYGLLCVVSAGPQVINTIGYTGNFLCAALFYFVMYQLYAEHKEKFRYMWHTKIRTICIVMGGLIIASNLATIIYMLINHVSYDVANEVIANYMYTFFYSIPFLP